VERNPRYYDAGKVCIDRIDFLPLTDAVAAERRVRRGEIDVNDTIQSSRVHFLRQPDQIPAYVRTHTYLSTSYVIFNRHHPALSRLNVRRALSMSIDRDFLTQKLMRAGQQPDYSFVPPGMHGYVPDNERPKPDWAGLSFPQRQAEARRLLALEGFTPQHPLRFEMKTANSTDSLLLGQAIQADWRLIGIDVTMRQEDPQISNQDFKLRAFDVGLISWILDYDDPTTFLGLFKSDTGQQNYGDFNSPQYDALMNRADQEVDLGRRAQILKEAEQLVVDDANIAPVYHGVNRNLVNPAITGWEDNFGDIHPVKYLCMRRAGAATATSGRTAASNH
jgi:oligopeptide transport system substrate-binding protein